MLSSFKWSPKTFVPDLGAGLTVALVSIPEGMAYALVAGVNPIYGLYTGMVTTVVASLTGSTSLLVVTLTNALALVTGEQLAGLAADADPIRAMFTLTLLVGVIMAVLGALKLGSVIRFVSKEVMAGFVFATAALIVLGQYKDLVGYVSELEASKFVKAIDITLNAGSWHYPTMVVGVTAIVLLVVLKASPLKRWADILIILIVTLVIILLDVEGIELVGDIAAVPSGLAALPKPVLPDFSLIPALLGGAFAATVVGLAESSGVGAAYPNPDGTRSNMSRDFLGQGLGNIAGSLFQTMPAGGSLSRTGVNASGGGKTRWSGVYAGLLMAIVLVLFGSKAELIPMTGLAAMLIVIGFEVMIKEGRELVKAWKVSRVNTIVAVITILVGVFDDLTAAIFIGVILSLLLYAFTSSSQIDIIELRKDEEDGWTEHALPKQIPSNQITVLEIKGNPYFASVYSFHELLPPPDDTTNAIIILRVRNRELHSLTGVEWLKDYAETLAKTGNQLILSGVGDKTIHILEIEALVEVIGAENIFRSEPKLLSSTNLAFAAASARLQEMPPSDQVNV